MTTMEPSGASPKEKDTEWSPVVALIRGELAAQKMKIYQLAYAAGITDGVMSRRLNGRSEFTVEELFAIAGALGYELPEVLRAAEEGRHSMPRQPGPRRTTPYVPRRTSGRPSAAGIDPWNLPFDGTPEQLASALWPLGVRLRAASDCSRNDRDGNGRVLGAVDWWPDDEELVVTPDLRSDRDETIRLLRFAERMRLDPESTAPFEMRQHTETGDRYMNLCLHAGL